MITVSDRITFGNLFYNGFAWRDVMLDLFTEEGALKLDHTDLMIAPMRSTKEAIQADPIKAVLVEHCESECFAVNYNGVVVAFVVTTDGMNMLCYFILPDGSVKTIGNVDRNPIHIFADLETMYLRRDDV